MGKILYVGNLTDSATQTNLEEWFAQYGTVHMPISSQTVTRAAAGGSAS